LVDAMPFIPQGWRSQLNLTTERLTKN